VKFEQTEVKQAEEAIVERFKSFGVLAILLAGLLEGSTLRPGHPGLFHFLSNHDRRET